MPQLSHVENGNDSSVYYMELLRKRNEMMNIKCLSMCLAHGKPSISISFYYCCYYYRNERGYFFYLLDKKYSIIFYFPYQTSDRSFEIHY